MPTNDAIRPVSEYPPRGSIFCEVPVLPATRKPGTWARQPVASGCTTRSSTARTRRAVSGCTTCRNGVGRLARTTSPREFTTSLTTYGRINIPSFASAA